LASTKLARFGFSRGSDGRFLISKLIKPTKLASPVMDQPVLDQILLPQAKTQISTAGTAVLGKGDAAVAQKLSRLSYGELSYHAHRALRRMRRRPTLGCAFWEQADLFPL
jgi:hypothetical protein